MYLAGKAFDGETASRSEITQNELDIQNGDQWQECEFVP